MFNNIVINKRSVVRTYVIAFCAVLLFTLSFVIYKRLGNIFTSVCLSLIPAGAPYFIYDVYLNYVRNKEIRMISPLLNLMVKWSAVKNDVVYCMQKANTSALSMPMDKYVKDTCIRLEKGMGAKQALLLCEKEVLSDDMRYILMNMRHAYEKGGSLYDIFKNLEQQYFKIDEESFKRKINTSTDRYAVYISIALAASAFYAIIFNPSAASTYYLNTDTGLYLVGVFGLLCFIAMIIIARMGG